MIPELVKSALDARNHAYAPYSRYKVGAALLASDGRIYQGCNVENASYGATNCAERTAFFKAVSEGIRRFGAIAIAGGPEGEPITEYAYPCGICRQFLAEFFEEDGSIILYNGETDKEISFWNELPNAFTGKNIK